MLGRQAIWVYLEQLVEANHAEDFLETAVQPTQNEVAMLLPGFTPTGNQRAQPAAVDVVGLAQVNHQLRPALVQQRGEVLFQDGVEGLV